MRTRQVWLGHSQNLQGSWINKDTSFHLQSSCFIPTQSHCPLSILIHKLFFCCHNCPTMLICFMALGCTHSDSHVQASHSPRLGFTRVASTTLSKTYRQPVGTAQAETGNRAWAQHLIEGMKGTGLTKSLSLPSSFCFFFFFFNLMKTVCLSWRTPFHRWAIRAGAGPSRHCLRDHGSDTVNLSHRYNLIQQVANSFPWQRTL